MNVIVQQPRLHKHSTLDLYCVNAQYHHPFRGPAFPVTPTQTLPQGFQINGDDGGFHLRGFPRASAVTSADSSRFHSVSRPGARTGIHWATGSPAAR